MLSINSTENLLGLQDVIVENIINTQTETTIQIVLKRKKHHCSHCGEYTDIIHDYRTQVIKDIPAFGKKVTIVLRKRRYRCKCGKRIAEENTFLPRYHRMTNHLSPLFLIN